MSSINVSRHPLVAHKISLLRDQSSSPKLVRELIHELAYLLMYEVTANLDLAECGERRSPLATYQGVEVKPRIGLVPVLRSGLGLVNAALELIPTARTLHMGIYREETSLQPVEYYNKLPRETNVDECIILDPMLATGGTAIATANILKDWGAKKITYMCICASQSGLDAFVKDHPDVSVFVGVIDHQLNSKGYVLPGIGDTGDRLFNTADH
ncbi:hypothetical protein H4R33_004807 [Dimargaris cristalligena]|uniref:uracil phosphoribosyltransferase n=1 Tax=Dimargaris cristalligena TaxID=215637 RepID=A0A4P9ZWK9_9FUNG|nr:hypothetical protein H4R33_004807 [Dimargaris cristalligena]RKP37351.1 uracil phosphoribosyltransferase [Dimargaris cristalligena]|eukprot:RKP37351.1 uracil phosphoribosyltransferase [Dimargaris cristalligena]